MALYISIDTSNKDWTKVPVYEFQEIIYEKKYFDLGGVARVTFNRPERMNALTGKGWKEFIWALDDADLDPTIGVVVLQGAGDKAFGSGGDVTWEAGELGVRATMMEQVEPEVAIRRCRKPIIAAVRGWCIGGHNHVAYFCDFTIAADNAKFGQNGPRVGSPAEGYVINYLVQVVGAKKARELWMLCRRYSPQEALAMGLINAVVPLDKLNEEVDKWCQEILSLSPTVIQMVKTSFDIEAHYQHVPLPLFQRLMAPYWYESEEMKEAQQAFLEKRKPNFVPIMTKKKAK